MGTWKTVFNLLNPRLTPGYNSNVDNAVAVIATPFNCYLRGGRPDRSNARIAEIAAHYITAERPFVGHWEHTSILCSDLPIHEITRSDRAWVQTHSFMEWVADEVLKRERGNIVMLVGHPHHVRRAAILARHYGLEPRVVPESATVPYDPRVRPGSQWWCLSRRRYIPWEYTSRAVLILLALWRRL